ncbi:MAG TPA: hypothetical protein VNA14_12185 [Mycobacteriales bacterium]|nr:hypothetical protein [Mycobacteriales bacterium]
MARGEQILVCPDCQRVHDWVSDLDTCAACASTRLVRTLGETRCLACGAVGEAAGGPLSPAEAPAQPAPGALAEDVSAALRRVFGPKDR